jgi:nitroreductase
MALSASEVKKLKQAPPVEGVLPVVLERWSARSYADCDVPPAEVEKIFEAVRWTASARNEQPWRFIVGLHNSETYKKIVHAMMEFTRPWASTAPVLVVCLAKTRFSHDGSPNPFHQYDLGAAGTTLMLQATWQGLCTRTLASFHSDELRKSLAIPEDYAIGSVIALGYQGDPAALPSGEMVAMETSSRARKSVNELVYSRWGEPLEFA